MKITGGIYGTLEPRNRSKSYEICFFTGKEHLSAYLEGVELPYVPRRVKVTLFPPRPELGDVFRLTYVDRQGNGRRVEILRECFCFLGEVEFGREGG